MAQQEGDDDKAEDDNQKSAIKQAKPSVSGSTVGASTIPVSEIRKRLLNVNKRFLSLITHKK